LQHKANEAQVKALEAQNSVLKETQFDRAVTLIEAQKKVYELDKANTAVEIGQLEKKLDESNKKHSEDLNSLREAQTQCMGKVMAVLGASIFKNSSGDTSVDDKALKLIVETATRIC
jgi:hypothetical protein